LLALRWLTSFLITVPLGILWGLAFIPAFPLSAAWRLDMDKTADDMEEYWKILGRILRAIRGANAKSAGTDASEKTL
jgi:hypothetical protein